MVDYVASLERLRRHAAVVQRMEFAIKNDPANRKLRIGLGSAQRREAESRRAFEDAAAANQIDLVRYKIANESNVFPVRSVADSIAAFQGSFTTIVNFLDSGPKETAKVSAAIAQETEMQFAYSYQDSLGVVLAVQNKRDFFSGKFDRVVAVFGEFLEISDTHTAIDASRRMGLALTSQLIKWAETNERWENDVDFIWRKSDGTMLGEHISSQQFSKISSIFREASDPEWKEFEESGYLVGLDLKMGTFHFLVPNEESYKGRLDDNFERVPTGVGERYRASIRMDVERIVATGKQNKRYTLRRLAPLKG